MKLAERFINEELKDQWDIQADKNNFKKLEHHLDHVTNFRSCFNEAFSNAMKAMEKALGNAEDLVIIDVGSGIGWTSAMMALLPNVRKVYSVEPNDNRRAQIPLVAQYFNAPEGKVIASDGSFHDFKVDEKAHMVSMVASIHHATVSDVPKLMNAINDSLLPKEQGGGWLMLANEHFVDSLWTLKRVISWIKWNLQGKDDIFFGPGKWRAPLPEDNEHWRSKKEVLNMLAQGRFEGDLVEYGRDVCNDKHGLYQKIGWHYYYTIARQKS